MGNYEVLKEAIKAVIKQNGAQEITGQIMQDTLLSIVSNLGSGATFAGIAKPDTQPEMSDSRLFYIAAEKGTYKNFGGAVVDKEALIFTNRSGSWNIIKTGLATQDSLHDEHSFFEQSLDKISTDVTELEQSLDKISTDVTELEQSLDKISTDVTELEHGDIAEIKNNIEVINGSINTAADELVRIEKKVDDNKKESILVFVPSDNTGTFKDADILGFTNQTASSVVNSYMIGYWDKLVDIASGKVAGKVYAETNNANCTGGECVGGSKFRYVEIDVKEYEKGVKIGVTESVKISFEINGTYTEMILSKDAAGISAKVDNFYSIANVNRDIYDLSSSNLIDGAYWSDKGKIIYDDVYECISIDVRGIKSISVSTRVWGKAKVLLIGYSGVLKIYENFFEEFSTEEIIIPENLYPTRMLISGTKNTGIKAVVTAFRDEYKGNLLSLNESIFGVKIIEIENDTAYNSDGSINHQAAGYQRVVIKNNKMVDLYYIKSVSEPKYASIVGYRPDGTIHVIQSTTHIAERLVHIDSSYKNFAISTKQGESCVQIYSYLNNITDVISDLVDKTKSLNFYGDSIAGLRIAKNSDYVGDAEQLLDNKYNNFCYYIAERNKLGLSDYSFEYATLTECRTKKNTDLQCILSDDAIISLSEQKPNYIILWYGINDVTYNPIMQRERWLKDKFGTDMAYPMRENEIGIAGYANSEQKAEVDKAFGSVGGVEYKDSDSYFFAKFVGTENDKDLTTWCGALNYAFPLLMSEYPEAKIMIICPDHNKYGKLIREATIKMAERWGVLYFDLNSLPYWRSDNETKLVNTQHKGMSWLLETEEYAEPTVGGFNKSRYTCDGVRPSDLGHRIISYPIGNKLING